MSKEARFLFILVYALVGLGVIMTYSTSSVYAEHVYKNPQHYLFRQVIFAVIGTVMLFVAASMPLQFWKDHARHLMLLAIFFLILVFIPVIGKSAGGAQRWIRLGPINFQPAEFAKVAVCLYLADYLARKKKHILKGGLKVFVPPSVLIGIACVLTLVQPDLGSTAFMALMLACLFFWAGIKIRYIATASLFFLPIFYLLVIRVPYRLSRVTAYLNPWEDAQGKGFQIIQSFLAFGLGGVHGVGLGEGMQKLFYLPSSYNDFIFSVITEEMGLIGAVCVIALFVGILICGIRISTRARNDYNKLLVVALTVFIVLQAVVHMLVTTGLVPTKGLPLPFVSYGGTSLVFNLMAVGILLGADQSLKGGRRRK